MVVDPEGHPGQDNNEDVGDVDLDEIVDHFAMQCDRCAQPGEATWETQNHGMRESWSRTTELQMGIIATLASNLLLKTALPYIITAEKFVVNVTNHKTETTNKTQSVT